MFNYIILFLISVFIASFSQILLKKSSLKKHSTIIKEYLNLNVILGYFLLFISAFLTTYSYRAIPLKFGPIIESVGYIYILFLGYFLINEKITRQKLLGNFIIIIGIFIFAI